MVEIDETDKDILSALFKNARRPLSEIARECGQSREVIAYRIERMERLGVIRGYITKIDNGHFCEGVGNLWVKLVRLDERRLEEIVGFLKAHPCVCFAAELCGNADLVSVLLYKSTEHLADLVSEITEFIGENLGEHGMWLYITEYKNDRSGLIHGRAESLQRQVTFGRNSSRKGLDSTDKDVLLLLTENCRMTAAQIAREIGASEDTVRARVKRMERRGVIYGYRPILGYELLGYEAYYLNLQIERMTAGNVQEIVRYVENNPYVGYSVRIAGRHNLHFSIFARNRQHFSEILSDIRGHFGPKLADYNFQLIMREHKEAYLPANFRF